MEEWITALKAAANKEYYDVSIFYYCHLSPSLPWSPFFFFSRIALATVDTNMCSFYVTQSLVIGHVEKWAVGWAFTNVPQYPPRKKKKN
jgi:hypothetical protein